MEGGSARPLRARADLGAALIAGGSLALAATCTALSLGPAETVPRVAPPAHPRRIVALGLHNDEIALALAPDRVVAVDTFADDPAASFAVDAARAVEGRASASVESVLGHTPDLVLLPGWVAPELEAGIARAGVAVVREPVPTRLDEIDLSLARLGALLDAREAAEGLRAELREAASEIDALPSLEPPPRAALVAATGTSPGVQTLFAELLERAGGRIALPHAGILPLSLEALLASDPEVLFLDGYRADGRARAVGLAPDEVVPLAMREHLSAYRNGRVHRLAPRVANTTSHHVASTLRELARCLRE